MINPRIGTFSHSTATCSIIMSIRTVARRRQDKTANLHYLERIVPFLNRGSLVIFDDIHWSQDMREMWRMAGGRQGFSYTIDAGRFGIGVWAGGTVQPKTYYLFRFGYVDLYEIKQCLERQRII